MRQGFTSNHFKDQSGMPAGGTTYGAGFTIGWQNGPTKGIDGENKRPNGAFVEDIIDAARERLIHYQHSEFACDENAKAISHLSHALTSLNDRTKNREERKVEGTHAV